MLRILRREVVVALVAVLVVVVPLVALAADVYVNGAARNGASSGETCVTNAAGGTTVTGFTARKGIEIQNQGPNAIWCRVDGGTPYTDSRSRKVAADTAWSIDAGTALVVKCIASTAAQDSGTHACTHVTQVR